jgi:hypothetical protein
MTQTDTPYQRSRDVWDDWNHRQEWEHDLINRKTSWWLTGQTILFAAYGLTLRSDFVDKSNEFRKVVAFSGLAVAVVTFLGIIGLIRSKRMSFRDYSEFYCPPSPKLPLPGPLEGKPLQWGVNTGNTWLTLVPDVSLPVIFAVAWLFLLRR